MAAAVYFFYPSRGAFAHVLQTKQRAHFSSLQALVIKESWNKRACVCANAFILQRIRFAFPPFLWCLSRLNVFTGRRRFLVLCNAHSFVWIFFFLLPACRSTQKTHLATTCFIFNGCSLWTMCDWRLTVQLSFHVFAGFFCCRMQMFTLVIKLSCFFIYIYCLIQWIHWKSIDATILPTSVAMSLWRSALNNEGRELIF